MSGLKDKTLILMASTYPRWPADTVSNFVEIFVNHMRSHVKKIEVITPHFSGAKRQEDTDRNVTVTRFRYTLPSRYENIAYGQFRKTPGYPIKVLLYTFSEFWTTLRIGLKSQPLILNPRWLIPQGFVGILLKPILGCKVVVSVHGADVFTLNGKTMRFIKSFVLKHADAVVVNSTASKAVCMDLCQRDDYVICPTGADTDRFKKPKSVKKNPDLFEILFVGRLVEEKGVMYLCKAMTLVRPKFSQVHLTIAGDGPEKPTIEKFLVRHALTESISLVGWIQPDDLVSYYAHADVFVGPSTKSPTGWREGFGTVFAEASSMGLPIIASRTGGIVDVVKDGVTGLLVPEKDTKALAEAITRLENDPELRKKLAVAGPKFIEDNYSLHVTTSKYLKIFESFISNA